MKTCSVFECDRPATKRGWCHTHYCRWWKHGDPDYRRQKKGTLVEGYRAFEINGRRYLAHRIVMGFKLGQWPLPEGMVVDHINGDKLDNRPENLQLSEKMANWRRGCPPHCATCHCADI